MRLVLASLALAFAAPLSAQVDPPTKGDLRRFEKLLVAAHAEVGPAMACVVVSRSDKYPKPATAPKPGQLGGFDPIAFLKVEPARKLLADQLDLSRVDAIPDHGYAGGVMIDPAGLVLTHYRTIEGAKKIYVHLPDGKGSYADIRAADERSDLAVLQLLTPPAGIKAVRFARTKTYEKYRTTFAPGRLALVIAFSYSAGTTLDLPRGGLASISGIRHPHGRFSRAKSAMNRSIYNYSPLLELDGRIGTDKSGAVVLNLEGEVIALTTSAGALPAGEKGPIYAMPVDENLLRIINVLRSGKEVEYGFLGVTNADRTARIRGVPIDYPPLKRSPAALAGLQPGDVITHINGFPTAAFEDLLFHVSSGLAGGELQFTLDRRNEDKKIETIKLVKYKNDMAFLATVRPEPVFGLRVEYTSVMNLFNFFGARSLGEIPPGVLVRELIPESPAAKKFKEIGENHRWVITHVDGKAVQSPAEFYREAKGRKTIRLMVMDPTENLAQTRNVTLP